MLLPFWLDGSYLRYLLLCLGLSEWGCLQWAQFMLLPLRLDRSYLRYLLLRLGLSERGCL